MQYSPYHRLIPERLELLHNIERNKHTVLHKIRFADRDLNMICIVINPKLRDTIMITAGCHGNEPAPIYALNEVLSKKWPKKRFVIVPCISPYGFCTNVDRNDKGKDINRDFFNKNPQKETRILKQLVKKYKPSFVLNLHEDPDERKFFLYLEGDKQKLAERLVKLSKMPYYKKKKIHNDIVINGIIKPKPSTSFEDYLIKNSIPNICIETPGLEPLNKRIQAHKRIINAL